MLESNTNPADSAAAEMLSAGALLKQAREGKGLSRKAVAEQLNLLLSHVVALEENNFARFPGETFVRGHLRSCARLLNIDAEVLLGAYENSVVADVTITDVVTADTPRTPLPKPSVKWRPVRLDQKNSRWRNYSGLAATALVLVALWSWQQHRDKTQLLSLTAESSSENDFAGGIDSALTSGAENALLDSVQLLPSSEVKPKATAAVAGDNSSSDSSSVATVDADKLSLRFSADCWIEIKDRDNRLIVATLKHADEKLQIEGRGPFKVLLGYAPGVSMAYNGAPVKVDVSEGSRSTRLIVGSS